MLCAANFLPGTVDSDVTIPMSSNEYRGDVPGSFDDRAVFGPLIDHLGDDVAVGVIERGTY